MISIGSLNQSVANTASSSHIHQSKRFSLRSSFLRRRSPSPVSTPKKSVKRSLSHSINFCGACHKEVHDTCSLCSQLAEVKQNKSITRLNLYNFVHNACPPQVGELKDLILEDASERNWETIRFHDTVQGSNYRRWRYKRVAVDRRVKALKKELENCEVKFITRVEIDCDEMDKDAIVSLLEALEKDRNVTTLSFTGHMAQSDVDDILRAIEDLATCDERVWDKITFRPSYGSSDSNTSGHAYFVWKRTLMAASLQLQCLAHAYALPIEFKLVEPTTQQ